MQAALYESCVFCRVISAIRFQIEMTQKLRIAICQFPVACNIAGNAKFIRRFMKKAVETEAHLVHFPETALSGYGRLDFAPSSTDNWQELEEQTKEIVNLAH